MLVGLLKPVLEGSPVTSNVGALRPMVWRRSLATWHWLKSGVAAAKVGRQCRERCKQGGQWVGENWSLPSLGLAHTCQSAPRSRPARTLCSNVTPAPAGHLGDRSEATIPRLPRKLTSDSSYESHHGITKRHCPPTHRHPSRRPTAINRSKCPRERDESRTRCKSHASSVSCATETNHIGRHTRVRSEDGGGGRRGQCEQQSA